MKFIKDFNYLIEEDFECEDILQQNKMGLLKYHNEHNKDKKIYRDIKLDNTPISILFEDKIKKLIQEIFVVEELRHSIQFNLYVQNNSTQEGNYHNHIHHPIASICGVFYTNIPKIGGEFNIIHFPKNPPSNPLKLKPEINKIYFFPSWLYHMPSNQSSEEDRICINFAYSTNNRPIIKGLGVIW